MPSIDPCSRTPRSAYLPACRALTLALAAVLCAPAAFAQTPPAPAPAPAPATLSDHARKDIVRHRAMAVAHEAAARCLESGKAEAECQKALAADCKGLAIGKYCGMRHEH